MKQYRLRMHGNVVKIRKYEKKFNNTRFFSIFLSDSFGINIQINTYGGNSEVWIVEINIIACDYLAINILNEQHIQYSLGY